MAAVCKAATRRNFPRFEEFRVPTPLRGRTGPAVIARPQPPIPGGPDETAEHLDKRVRDEERKGPNFAGHYTIVLFSCGSDCANMGIVDVLTGHVYDTPFVGVLGCPMNQPDTLLYHLDSRLFVVNGSLELAAKSHMISDGPCGTFYYEWTGKRLKLIRSRIWRRSDKNSDGIYICTTASGGMHFTGRVAASCRLRPIAPSGPQESLVPFAVGPTVRVPAPESLVRSRHIVAVVRPAFSFAFRVHFAAPGRKVPLGPPVLLSKPSVPLCGMYWRRSGTESPEALGRGVPLYHLASEISSGPVTYEI
jgi:hypothetical protein